MANDFYNRGASFNPDELADGDAIEAEFDAVARGFDTIEDLVNVNKAGYPTQTFFVAPATDPAHAVQKDQLDDGLALKLNATSYTADDVLSKIKTVDGSRSGLDADLLDGQDGAYYRNATNINAGTLDKARLPASVDANTTGNAATATKTTATAPTGSSAELMRGAMGGNDYFLIRIGGNAGAGWSEIATADNGTEPIYVRQYTGDFASVANEITLLDASGNTVIPGNLKATTGGVTVKDTGGGIYPGNGDSASKTVNNVKLASWFGIGFGPSISGQAVPLGEYSHWFNVRNGDMGIRGTFTASQLNGNAATATKLATARQINGVNFDGSANITIADSTKLPSAGGDLGGSINFTPDSGVVLAFDGTPAIQRFAGANSKSMGIGADDTLFLGAGESVATMTTNITAGPEDVHIGAETNVFIHVSPDNWASWATKKTFSIDATNGPMWAGGKVWNAGNDGSGSGLDADLLDGQDGAYYRNASNINAGTIGDAYLPKTISSSITGNASSATKLKTAMTISLSGDVTGSVAFDGSANATINAAISNAGVLASCAAASAGGVGTYVFGYINNNAAFAEGVTYAGSSIKPAAIQKTLAAATVYGGYRSASTLSGTWRAMGAAGASNECNFTLFLRIS